MMTAKPGNAATRCLVVVEFFSLGNSTGQFERIVRLLVKYARLMALFFSLFAL
jgi:hypothetical protein